VSIVPCPSRLVIPWRRGLDVLRPHQRSTRLLTLALAATLLIACSEEDTNVLDPGSAPPPSATADPSAPVADGGAGPTTSNDGGKDAPPPSKVLAAPIAALAAEVASRSPGTEAGLAALDLDTGEYAGANDDVLHVSASSPKAIWVAAALAKVGIGSVDDYAKPIFESSDNAASGTVIDLAGGMNAINVFYAKAGMTNSAITQWYGGRVATNSPKKMGSDNYFTARDAVTFLAKLDAGALLGQAETNALRQWMTWSPRTGFGGWLGTLLPEGSRKTMMHKGGWLPPGCCGDDATYNTLNEIGIVPIPNGHRYAIAILARRGNDWYGKQAPWVERASCVIHRAVAQLPNLDCKD
jgi:beta-lactamase class A